MKRKMQWEKAMEFCETLTEEEDALTREMVTRLADKWSLWTMAVLAGGDGPLRFSRIMKQVGVSGQSWVQHPVSRHCEDEHLGCRAQSYC